RSQSVSLKVRLSSFTRSHIRTDTLCFSPSSFSPDFFSSHLIAYLGMLFIYFHLFFPLSLLLPLSPPLFLSLWNPVSFFSFPLGTASGEQSTGACLCRPGVTGERCDSCSRGHCDSFPKCP